MLSRRGVRIKVMQMLYAASRDETLTIKGAKNAYLDSVERTFNLYLFAMYAIEKICRVSHQDEVKRKSKYLPTEKDKSFVSKLYDNDIIQSLAASPVLNKKAEKLDFKSLANADFAQNIYSEFSKDPAYHNYVFSETTHKNDLDILLELFRFCRKSEFFCDVMEDGFSNWVDDKSLVIGTVKKTIKSLPKEGDIFKVHYPEPEIVEDFGLELMDSYFEDDDELLDIIKPILENWDHERLAIIDTILIKLALCEFLYFKTIPVKVTLNEYVEISKLYSTPKSKEFINGILDKLLKKLEDEGKVKKEGRGLIE